MRHLNKTAQNIVLKQILSAPNTVLFLDYDGTLAPIQSRPEKAKITERNRKTLLELSQNTHCSVVMISGRKLSDLRSQIRLKNIAYAGNHGLEIQGNGFCFLHPHTQQIKKNMTAIKNSLRFPFQKYPGAWVENKVLTLTCHYRQLPPQNIPAFSRDLHQRLTSWISAKKIKILKAKKALEIRPNIRWNKGYAVKWILAKKNKRPCAIYMGDDWTDEDAFKKLKTCGITIRVGFKKNSFAKYFVKNTKEAEHFLALLSSSH